MDANASVPDACHRPTRSVSSQCGGRSAFTLLELVIVIVVPVIIAAIAIPRASSATAGAKPAAFARTLDSFVDAGPIYSHEHHASPSDGGTGAVPSEPIGLVDEPAWSTPTPAGGSWDCDTDFGVAFGVGVAEATDLDVVQAIERLIDNGDVNTGTFRVFGSDRCSLVLDMD